MHWWKLNAGYEELSVELTGGGNDDVFAAWLVSETAPYGFGCVSAWGSEVGPLTPPEDVTTVEDTTTVEITTAAAEVTTMLLPGMSSNKFM